MMTYEDSLELEHFGVKGMKWGVRRYQNADGTLTAAGKEKLKNYKFKERNKVSAQMTKYTNSAKRYREKKKQKGIYIRPEKNKEIDKRISDFKKELKAIEKMKFSDMQEERIARGKQWAKLYGVGAFAGVPGVALAQITGIVQNPSAKISDMRIERVSSYDSRRKQK